MIRRLFPIFVFGLAIAGLILARITPEYISANSDWLEDTLYLYKRLSLCKSILKKIRFGSLQTSIRRHPVVSGRPNGESARARLYSW